MKTLVLASSNRGKIDELQKLLASLDWRVLPQSDFVVPDIAETGSSFAENALIKARNAAQFSGLPAIADDSGLCVDALNGAPGIFSARYAGTLSNDANNNQKLLAELANTPDEKRGAHFHCALVFVKNAEDPHPIVCEQEWHGKILTTPLGKDGFGYDPLFFVPTHGCSSAQLSMEEKNKISHRGQALRTLVAILAQHTHD